MLKRPTKVVITNRTMSLHQPMPNTWQTLNQE